jgi:acetyl esterase
MTYLESLNLPGIDRLSPADARQQYREVRAALRPPAAALPSVRDIVAGTVRVRLYRPGDATLPAFVFFHGGGWVVGDLETHDIVCREIALQANVVVAAVDYRLAPEHPFPAAVDDAWSATTWLAAHAAELGIDATRIAVGGDSAGGGLAAVVALMGRDSAKLRLTLQVLIYPVTDLRARSESYATFAEGFFLTRAAMHWFITQYAATDDAREDWRASPLLAPWVHGVAPALIIAAELDPLVDEGAAYGRRLQGARVPVEYQVLGGMIHGFLTMGGKIDAARRAVSMIADRLKRI